MRKYFFFILYFLIVGCLFSCDKAKNYMLGSFEPYREMFGLSHIDVEDSIINVTIPAPSSFVRVGELVYEVEPTVIDEEVFNYLHSGDYMGDYYINLFTTYTDEYGQEQKTKVGIIGQVPKVDSMMSDDKLMLMFSVRGASSLLKYSSILMPTRACR